MAQAVSTFDAPRGRMPTLQFVPPAELQVDPSYQRSVASGESQALIRRIARAWNWGLCQPLVVSRRLVEDSEELFVIDGQHRLEAAKLRGDIAQLPCVIAAYRTAADEAADFVQINKQRRALSKLEVFRAAVASGEPDALAILSAIEAAGLSLATHTNYASWKPGQLGAITGLEAAWKRYGDPANRAALDILAKAMPGQVLQYAGTIYPGIAAWCADQIGKGHLDSKSGKMVTILSGKSQAQWRADVLRIQIDSGFALSSASVRVVQAAWTNGHASAAPKPVPAAQTEPEPKPAPKFAVAPAPKLEIGFMPDTRGDGRTFCGQCDQRVSAGVVTRCTSPWCKLRDVA
ncbi:DUF6551 family protein [uncultured Novosphingobium sp.]|uniref:DUF6551 family protein n=1 Tax=uncultured Novosphingobium sp. TaxID=292277 RepID=UPI0025901D40|nr:DUF6551 family protein [uncultured Novosphingobium sp.]